MSMARGGVWVLVAGLGLTFALGAPIDAALTQAFGPNPITHVSASPWLWGAGPIAGWPAWAPLAFAALGAALAAYAARVRGWTQLRVWTEAHWGRVRIVVAALALGGLWYWRVAGSQGDAFKYLIMLRDDKWFVMSQPLSTALFSLAYAVLQPLGWPPAGAAAVVNVLAGAVWLIAALSLARTAPVASIAVITAIVAGGVVVFFGYIETMAWPLALATLYLLAAQRALAGRSPWPAALCFGLTVAAHGQMLLLGPSLLVVAFEVLRRQGGWRAAAFAALAAAPIALIVGVALLNQDRIYDTLVGDALGGGDQRMFVPLVSLTTTAERYTLFSGWHLWEIVNLMLRAGPWLPVTAVGAMIGWRGARLDARRVFWALVFAGSVAFVALWNADFGMNLDWDLYAPPVMLALLAAAMLWPPDWRLRPGVLGAMAGLNFGATALSLLTFVPTAAWNPWNVDVVLSGRPLYARYGDVAELVSVDLPTETARAGETWSVTTTWRLRRPTEVQYTSAVHVIALTPDGPRLVAQHDARPVAPVDWPNPRFTDAWIVGELVPDAHAVPIPGNAAPGVYEAWAVLYDLATGQRLAVGDGDHVVIGNVTITGP
ncbi:MAG: hypothetical protein JNL73_01060 [Anaerolineales bacterium]|nr:hypothetical protein [Anaerolineales bacterium]